MKNLEIKCEKWNTQAALFLEPACNDDYSINELAYDVQASRISLFNVYENGMHIASMALRIDSSPSQKELVVVALGGKRGGNLICALSQFWDDLAIRNKAKTIRAHVSKKGMTKLMERVGGQLSEYVYRKEVNHGRTV